MNGLAPEQHWSLILRAWGAESGGARLSNYVVSYALGITERQAQDVCGALIRMGLLVRAPVAGLALGEAGISPTLTASELAAAAGISVPAVKARLRRYHLAPVAYAATPGLTGPGHPPGRYDAAVVAGMPGMGPGIVAWAATYRATSYRG